MSPTNELPNIAEALGRFLQREPMDLWPLLIALGERMAADRYRVWAGRVEDADQKAALLACAEREEEVALRVEALHPDAATVQAGITERNPDFGELGRAFFETGSLDQQFRLQAQAERLGAATWKSCARRQSDAAARNVFLGCAALDEENALVLEGIAASVASTV